MLGESDVTVVTTLVCFFILHARLRAQRAPGIPCALWFEGKEILANLERITLRDRGRLSPTLSENESLHGVQLKQPLEFHSDIDDCEKPPIRRKNRQVSMLSRRSPFPNGLDNES
jgi:hypothetical protein